MKTINNFLIAGFVITAFACNTNMDEVLSSTDLAALQAMEASYTGAIEANNTLATYVETTGITNGDSNFEMDAQYHQYDSMFEANHMMYSHNNGDDDHDSDSWMMGNGAMYGNNGGMMSGSMSGNNTGMNGNGFDASHCSWNNLDLMDSLMEAHEQYHPTN